MTDLVAWAKQARKGKRGRLLGALQAAKARLSTSDRVSTYTQQQAIFLELAEQAAAAGAIDVAWQMVFAAERAAIEGYSDAERAAHRDMLLSEATDKLDSWRRDAVLRLLAGPPTLGALQAATRIRDERHENVYRQQSLVKSQLNVGSRTRRSKIRIARDLRLPRRHRRSERQCTSLDAHWRTKNPTNGPRLVRVSCATPRRGNGCVGALPCASRGYRRDWRWLGFFDLARGVRGRIQRASPSNGDGQGVERATTNPCGNARPNLTTAASTCSRVASDSAASGFVVAMSSRPEGA